MGSSEFLSTNKEFRVTVEGLFYEGYASDQQITLRNRRGHILWKKVERIWSPPEVSNKGEVALLGRQITFYDNSGKAIGTFTPSSAERFWTSHEDGWPIHHYSPDGDRYATILRIWARDDDSDEKKETYQLISLSRTGIERWRFALPNELIDLSSQFELSDERVLIHTYAHAAMRIQNYCYLISDSGTVVASYTTKLLRPCHPTLNNSASEFSLCEGDSLKTYSLITAKLIRTSFNDR